MTQPDLSIFETSTPVDENQPDLTIFENTQNPVIAEAVKVNPAEQAKLNRLSRESQLPPDMIEGDLQGIEQDLKTQSIDLSKSPKTADWMSKYENAAVAHTDVDTLKNVELTMADIPLGIDYKVTPEVEPETVKDLLKAWGRGSGNLVSSLGQLLSVVESGGNQLAARAENIVRAGVGAKPVVPADTAVSDWLREIGNQTTIAPVYEPSQYSRDRAADVQAAEGFFGTIKALGENPSQIFEGVVQSAPSFVGPAAITKIAGITNTAKTVAVTSGAIEGGAAGADARQQVLDMSFADMVEDSPRYVDMVAQGVDPQKAKEILAEEAGLTATAITVPIATLLTKATGAADIEGQFFTDQKVFDTFAKWLKGTGVEAVEETGQSATSQVATNVGVGTTGDQTRDPLQGVEEAAAQGAVLGAAQAGGIKSVDVVRDIFHESLTLSRAIKQRESVFNAQQKTIDKLAELSDQAELKKLDAESFKQFVNHIDGDRDTRVHLDAVQTQLYLNSLGDKTDPAITMLREALGEAATLGYDVTIPVGDFAATIAGSPHFDALREFMSMSDNSPSPFRKESDDAAAREYLRSLIDTADENVTLHQQKQQYADQVREQLVDTGRMSAKDAAMSAAVVPEWATSFAKRNGMTLEQVKQQLDLKIEGPLSGELSRLTDELQKFDQESKEFKYWFGDSKITDETGKPMVVYSGTGADLSNKSFTFDYSKIGKNGRMEGAGFYFTRNKDIASGYGNVISAYLSIKKPLSYDQKLPSKTVIGKLIREIANSESKKTNDDIADGFLSNYDDVRSSGLSGAVNSAIDILSNNNTFLDLISDLVSQGVDIETVNRAVTKVTGYDGVVAKGFSNQGQESDTIYVAFFPEQVKSVDAKIFDLESGDIFNQFAGVNSRTAIMDDLERAKQMREKGLGNDATARQTGWFLGVDGRWRYEISDDQAKWRVVPTADPFSAAGTSLDDLSQKIYGVPFDKLPRMSDSSERQNIIRRQDNLTRLDNYLDHPELFKAYPQLGSIRVTVDDNMDDGDLGVYFERQNTIQLNSKSSPEQMLSTVLHELQHAIQSIEDFARGGSMNADFTNNVKNAIQNLSKGKTEEVEQWEWRNQWKIKAAEKAAEISRNGVMYRSAMRLIDYANRDKPSSVFRHIRNESQWIYGEQFYGNREANDLQRLFFDMPRSGAKRNEAIRKMSHSIGEFLLRQIPEDQLYKFKNDERTTDSMLKALSREASLLRRGLKPFQELKAEAKRAVELDQATLIKNPYEIYRALAGEIEARTTQNRMKLTPEQRRTRPVSLDQDLPSSEAIVVVGGMELKVPEAMMSQEPMIERDSFKRLFGDKNPNDYDFEFPITHESSDPKFNGVIHNKGSALFKGVFALYGFEGAALGYGDANHTYLPRKDKVAGSGDSDLDYEKTISFLKKKFPDASDDEIDLLYRYAAEDNEISRDLTDEDHYRIREGIGAHPLADILPKNIGDASWRLQDIRGEIAIDQGFDAIAMSDENGTSYFIPFGTKAIYIGKDVTEGELENIKSAIENNGKFNSNDPDIFNQKSRGYYEPKNSLIRLNESSNLSTFLHEFAHAMYEMELVNNGSLVGDIHNWFKRNAKDVAAEAQTIINQQTPDFTKPPVIISNDDVVAYLDNKTTGDTDKDSALRIATHEQFARGYEAYLMEGKSPSEELRDVFRTFTRWLVAIYKNIRGLNVKLDDDARRFFDRLTATDVQIRAAQARANYSAMFNDASMAGMSDKEFEKYQQQKQRVKDKADETLRDKMIAQLRRRTEKWWREEKQDVIDQVKVELNNQPVYRAINGMRSGTVKMDHQAVLDLFGEDVTNAVGIKSRRIPTALRNMTVKGAQGVRPDDAAAFFGFASASEMVEQIKSTPSLNKAADEKAEQIMVDRHGDILNDGTIEKEADEAVQNEERAELLLMELKALAKGSRIPVIDRQVLKATAEDAIAKLSYREIHPAKYRRAEIRAAQESAVALKNGNREEATRAKARQLMNHYLANAATDARNETMRIVDSMSRYSKKKVREEIMKAEGGYWEQIVNILSRFEFRKSATLDQVDQVNQGINLWAKERIEVDGDGLVLSPVVLNELYQTHWKNVKFSDLKGIADSVKNIEYVARYSNKLTRMGDELEFKQLVTRWVDHLKQQPVRFSSQRTDTIRGKNWGRWAMAQMTKIPYLCSWLDGNERVGLSHQILMQPLNDAYSKELALWKTVGNDVLKALESRSAEDRKRHATKIFIKEIQDEKNDGNLFGSQILAVALNTGNESNLRKMLLGEGWANPDDDTTISMNNPQLKAVLKHMTKSDWDLVQLLWDKMEELYPQLAEVHRRTTGLTPPKIEATKITTPFGEYRGGYYPVKYDPGRSFKSELNEEKLNAQTESMFATSGSIQASVNASATNERTKYYAPINLNLDVIPNHFQETIHYITHHDAVREINKLLRNPSVAEAIKGVVGPEEYAQLRPWLNDVAKDGREAPAKMFWDAVLQRLRFGVTLGSMGFKVSTAIMQLSGLSNTVAEVGIKNVYKSLRTILGSPKTMQSAWDFASENSKILKYRTQTMDREIKNALNQLAGKNGMLAAVQELSMKHIAYTQTFAADLPSWYAAYIKKMDETGDEQKAFQYADWVVENIQGSGATKDMARIMRGQSEAGKMFTMFMTFFSALWNMERDLVKGVRNKTYSVTTVGAKVAFLFTLPVLFEMLVRGEFGGDDDDDETLLQKTLTKTALFPFQSIPFVRDMINGATGDYGYNISPVASLLEQGMQSVPELITRPMTDEEITLSQVKGASKFAGAAFGIPGTSQAWSTGESLYDVLVEGEDRTIREILVTGPDKQ